MTTTLSPRDPWRGFLSFPRLIEDFEANFQRGLKIKETEQEIIVEAVVAGVPADMVEVDIEDGVLTIKADYKQEQDTKEGGRKQSSYSYYYTSALSGGQWDKAEAEVEHGIVVVTIPKSESVKPRKIAVKSKK